MENIVIPDEIYHYNSGLMKGYRNYPQYPPTPQNGDINHMAWSEGYEHGWKLAEKHARELKEMSR